MDYARRSIKKKVKKTKLRDVSYSLNTIDLRKEIFWFVLFFLVFKCGNQFVHFLAQTKKKKHKKLSFKREKFGIEKQIRIVEKPNIHSSELENCI